MKAARRKSTAMGLILMGISLSIRTSFEGRQAVAAVQDPYWSPGQTRFRKSSDASHTSRLA